MTMIGPSFRISMSYDVHKLKNVTYMSQNNSEYSTPMFIKHLVAEVHIFACFTLVSEKIYF